MYEHESWWDFAWDSKESKIGSRYWGPIVIEGKIQTESGDGETWIKSRIQRGDMFIGN